MEHYTAQIIVNGEFRTMLIYKSETPVKFEDPSRHSFTIPGDNSTIQVVYITDPGPYRTVTPEESDSGPYYFYWFLVQRVDTTELVTGGGSGEGFVTYGELAAAIREGVNSVE